MYISQLYLNKTGGGTSIVMLSRLIKKYYWKERKNSVKMGKIFELHKEGYSVCC